MQHTLNLIFRIRPLKRTISTSPFLRVIEAEEDVVKQLCRRAQKISVQSSDKLTQSTADGKNNHFYPNSINYYVFQMELVSYILERLSNQCRKTLTKEIAQANNKGRSHYSIVNQSKLEACTANSH